ERLVAGGWTAPALRAGALSTGFDMWRALAVTYASAYGRYGVDEHPCGYRFAAQNLDLSPRPASAVERAAWWSEASGLPPGPGVGIVDPSPAPPGLGVDGLRRLRALWEGADADARRVQAGIAATRARLPRERVPVVVVHGIDDGLIPIAFSSAPYVEMARAAGRDVRFWQVRNAQHFDSFLGLPELAARYVPLLPYLHAALDRVAAFLEGAAALPGDALIEATPRRPGRRLGAWNLAIPWRTGAPACVSSSRRFWHPRTFRPRRPAMSRPRHFSMFRDFQLADWFTLGNAVCGTGAVFAAMRFLQDGVVRDLLAGMALIPLAFVLDALDGRIARWRKVASTLGRELDSLADVISFGLAPAALGYACGLQGGWDWVVLSFFVGCGVSRLARYNVTAETLADGGDKVKYFE